MKLWIYLSVQHTDVHMGLFSMCVNVTLCIQVRKTPDFSNFVDVLVENGATWHDLFYKRLFYYFLLYDTQGKKSQLMLQLSAHLSTGLLQIWFNLQMLSLKKVHFSQKERISVVSFNLWLVSDQPCVYVWVRKTWEIVLFVCVHWMCFLFHWVCVKCLTSL